MLTLKNELTSWLNNTLASSYDISKNNRKTAGQMSSLNPEAECYYLV